MVAYLPILYFNSNRSTSYAVLTPVNILRLLHDRSNSNKNTQRLCSAFPCLCINGFILLKMQMQKVDNVFIHTRAEVSRVGAGSAGVAALAPRFTAHLYPSVAALRFNKSSNCQVSLRVEVLALGPTRSLPFRSAQSISTGADVVGLLGDGDPRSRVWRGLQDCTPPHSVTSVLPPAQQMRAQPQSHPFR